MTDTETTQAVAPAAEPPKELRALRDRILRFEKIPIAEIDGFRAGNPKQKDEQHRAQLETSLDVNGFVSPVLVRELRDDERYETGDTYRWELQDGHARIEEIVEKFPGTTHVWAAVLDVKTTAEGRMIIMGLQPRAEYDRDYLDEWMRDALKEGLELDKAMALTGFTAADLDSLAEASAAFLEQLPDPEPRAKVVPREQIAMTTTTSSIVTDVDIDDAPSTKAVSKIGDLWKLGDHRLLVGDPMHKRVVAAALDGAKPDLIWAQPPIVATPANTKAVESTKKKAKEIAAPKIHGMALAIAETLATWAPAGTPMYLAIGCDEQPLMFDMLDRSGWHRSSTISWVAQSSSQGRKDYHSQWMPIWYGWRDGASRRCAPTDRAQSDVWQIDRPRKADLYPQMMPIQLVARAVSNSSKPGDLVADLFACVGVTLLACEQLGRRMAAVESDPRYADVIVDRWQKLTGRKATRSASGAK